MARVRVRPQLGFDEVGWRITLEKDGEERWLATLSDARLAVQMAEQYAKDNQAKFVPFDTEAFEALSAMLRAVAVVPNDIASVRQALQDVLAARASLCERFRRKQRKRVTCDGCPIKEGTGASNCKRMPFGLLKTVMGSPKAPMQYDMARGLLSLAHATLMHMRDDMNGG